MMKDLLHKTLAFISACLTAVGRQVHSRLAFFLALLLSSSITPSASQTDSLIQAGIRLSSEGRFSESVDALLKAGADTGTSAVRSQLGLAYSGLNDFPSARKYLSEAVALDSANVSVRFLYARFLQLNLVLAEATEAFRAVMLMDTTHAPAAFQLAQIARAANEPDSVVRKLYRRAIRLNPSDYVAMYYLGSSLADSAGTRHEGEHFLKRSLEFNPSYLPSIERLASHYSHNGDDSTSARYFTMAVALRPRNPEFWFYLGETLRKLQQNDSAIACFLRAIEIDPTKASYPGQLGYAYFQAKDYVSSAKAYRRAISLERDNVQFYTNLALTFARLDSIDLAARAYDQAIRVLDPSQIALMYANKGHLYVRADRYAEAAKEYANAAIYEPGNSGHVFYRAFALDEGKRFEEAARYYKTYVRMSQNEPATEARRHFVTTRLRFIETELSKEKK